MKSCFHFAFLASAACFCQSALATDLIIDRVLITRHPLATPYYVYVAAKASHAEASFNVPKKAYGSGNSAIEIPLNLTLKDVQMDSWATVTLQLDTKDETVTTFAAIKKHTAKIRITSGSSTDGFIPSLDGDNHFTYELFWHTASFQSSETLASTTPRPPSPPTLPTSPTPPAKRAEIAPISPELFSAYLKLQEERQALDTTNPEAVAQFNQHAANYHAALKKAREVK